MSKIILQVISSLRCYYYLYIRKEQVFSTLVCNVRNAQDLVASNTV